MKKLQKLLIVLSAIVLQATPTLARDMIDEKTNELTPYGLAIVLIASAQVSEMRCGTKGQMDLAFAKARSFGVQIDADDKEDYSAILFQATEILADLKKNGAASWCKAKAANLDQLLRQP
jgi:hypothetical protein